MFLHVDWRTVFVPQTPILEIVIRGSLIYLSLYAILRLVLRRESGKIGIADLLLIVLIADAAQNGMAGEYRSVTDGVILVATLVFWNYALDWLAYHFPRLRKIIHPSPALLVKNGRLLRKNLREELISEDELRGMMREQGVTDLAEVKEAWVERDGGISVIKNKPSDAKPKQPKDKGD